MIITSVNNELIRDLVRLRHKKYRDQLGILLVEGDHLVEEAQAAKLLKQTLGIDAGDVLINEAVAAKLSETVSGSKVFGVVRLPQQTWVNGTRYLLCDGVQDPGNLGTIIRTAYSFGFTAVCVSLDCADAFSPKCVRASQGAVFHMPVIRGDLSAMISRLLDEQVVVYAAVLDDDASDIRHLEGERMGFVVGSEGRGLSDEVLKKCERTVKIATQHFDSLNVAVASAIICYEMSEH